MSKTRPGVRRWETVCDQKPSLWVSGKWKEMWALLDEMMGVGWSWMLFIMKMWTFTIVQLLKVHRMKAWYQAYGTWGKFWLPFFSFLTTYKKTFLFFSPWWYNLLAWTDCGGLPCHIPKPIGQLLLWSETSTTLTPHQSALVTSWLISSTYKNSNGKLMSTTQLSYY